MQTTVDESGQGRLTTAHTLKNLGLSPTSQKTLKKYAKALRIDTSRGYYYTKEIKAIAEAMRGAEEEGSLAKWLEKVGIGKAQEEAKKATEQAKKQEREEAIAHHEEAREEGAIALTSLSSAYSNNAQKLAEIAAENFLNDFKIYFFKSLGVKVSEKLQVMEGEMNNFLEGTMPKYLLDGVSPLEEITEE